MRQLRRAEVKDIPAILEILSQNLLAHNKNLTPAELETQGFLKNGFTAAEAEAAIQDTDNFIFFVATDGEEIIGYVSGCSVSHLNQPFQDLLAGASAELYRQVYQQKSIYLRHIAKQTAVLHVGQSLLDALLAEAKVKAYQNIICQIMQAPLANKPSLAFHEKNGFVQIGQNLYQDERWGIFSRPIK
jgi:L-amino acid N-acyltransferase YncA